MSCTTTNVIRVRKRLESSVLDLPELVPLVGKDVEIIVIEERTAREPPPPAGPKPGSAKGKVWMADDFDAPLEDFEPYMR